MKSNFSKDLPKKSRPLGRQLAIELTMDEVSNVAGGSCEPQGQDTLSQGCGGRCTTVDDCKAPTSGQVID